MQIVGRTKSALALGIGVSAQYINKINKGERRLSLDKKKKLRDFYQSKVDLLIEKIVELDNDLMGNI